LEDAAQAAAGIRRLRIFPKPHLTRSVLRPGRRLASAEDYPRKSEDHMKNLALKVQRFLVSEDGPTAVEYAVMLALIIIVCLTAITAVGNKASQVFTNVSTSLSAAS